jgi:hypothetical protein
MHASARAHRRRLPRWGLHVGALALGAGIMVWPGTDMMIIGAGLRGYMYVLLLKHTHTTFSLPIVDLDLAS